SLAGEEALAGPEPEKQNEREGVDAPSLSFRLFTKVVQLYNRATLLRLLQRIGDHCKAFLGSVRVERAELEHGSQRSLVGRRLEGIELDVGRHSLDDLKVHRDARALLADQLPLRRLVAVLDELALERLAEGLVQLSLDQLRVNAAVVNLDHHLRALVV